MNSNCIKDLQAYLSSNMFESKAINIAKDIIKNMCSDYAYFNTWYHKYPNFKEYIDNAILNKILGQPV